MPEADGGGPPVRRTTDRGIATITLDSERNRNALSAPLRTALLAELRAAMADASVRAVVLTGAGTVFCAGADLKEVAERLAGRDPDPGAPGMGEVFSAIMDAPKPVVARLNGTARAGGLGLVAAADMAIAPEDTGFAFTEVRIGLVPAVISVPVRQRLNDRALSRYLLTGEVFGAREAVAAGLLTEAVPRAELDAAVERAADGLRAAAPGALAGAKALLAGRGAEERAAEFARMTELSESYFAGEEAAEGRSAFFEKRGPRWVL
ncbi:enoyl-CoA hydratase-related protein [Nocardiopsis suaedae]|uniref:Enoyl-CoA hydratase-related protein n=1 Tax=Nocardiopsis suaedae TaxID=3018444 RepID=A0ABT4TRP5_9ACTN|nr:enoyl-CoA hydratase-related protein [Nocardiopsis suaedae]MDA2807344.1 enoyl-CoA hydratase-related protein [Nocardiopsis suaedae]